MGAPEERSRKGASGGRRARGSRHLAGVADVAFLGPNAGLISQPGSHARLCTPALVLDLAALERNIAAMAVYCARHGVALRPHAKTHKSVEVARRQLEAGAMGISVATIGEAERLTDGGMGDL